MDSDVLYSTAQCLFSAQFVNNCQTFFVITPFCEAVLRKHGFFRETRVKALGIAIAIETPEMVS